MCGIVGAFDFSGIDKTTLAPRIDRALERLSPRGPDGSGTWFSDHCAFGHARLAVIDLTEGAAQPMERQGLVATYNGEIYNFQALREKLSALGWSFTSKSDTEVLLIGWKQWGEGLFEKLVGMFALAIWDTEKSQGILVRDRFGKKPLYYRAGRSSLHFASDLVALTQVDPAENHLNLDSLSLLFALRYIPDPHSIISEVHKLPPGHMARFDKTGLTIDRWYELARAKPDIYPDEREAQDDLRRTLDQAIVDRLVSDVPVGAFLSGGIDSAIVAASLVEQGQSIKTFTVGFASAAEYYEERPAARRIADHLGVDHTEIEITPEDALSTIENVFIGCDEPFADSSTLPQYLLAKTTSRHVTVALSGDGADEIFGGYRKHQGELHAAAYRRIPRILRQGFIEPIIHCLPESKNNPLLERFRQLRRFVGQAGKMAPQRQAGWARLLSDETIACLLRQHVPSLLVEDLFVEERERSGSHDPINQMLAADIAIGLCGDMLVKVDRMSMANSLEVRCPFIDHRVIECAAAMPGTFKLKPGSGKDILRKAYSDILPAEVFQRPKKGFELPIGTWLTDQLSELTLTHIDPTRLKQQGIFDPLIAKGWFDQLKGGQRDRSWELWTMIAFQQWFETHGREMGISTQ